MERKFTDDEIVKAAECCASEWLCCSSCPLSIVRERCFKELILGVVNLINRQKAEIERLRAKVEKRTNEKLELGRIYTQKLKATKAEAIISFAKRLCDGRASNDPVVIAAEALLKELTEDKP